MARVKAPGILFEEQLANSVADSIAPMIMPDIDIVSLEGKSMLCIRVAHWPGPFYLESEGKEQQLISLGLLTHFAGRNVVTYGGLILFGRHNVRQMVLPDARVSCARFRGKDKAHFIDRLDLEGSILDTIKQVPNFIARNTRLFPKIAGMVREDIPAYPDFVIREILVNSIVHCDYSLIGMRVMVGIFSDRLEIQSPGILPFGMTLDDFKSGVSRIRNRVIARTFKELGIMEEWGSGYKRIVDYCVEHGYPVPVWQEVGPVLRVIVVPHPEAEESSPHVTPHVKKLLVHCRKELGRGELQKHIGVKDRKHFYEAYLTPAMNAGLIEFTIPDKPKSKFQKYRLTTIGWQWLED